MTESSSSPGSEERIGAYRIVELLGRGGMGEVFLAWDDRLKRRVAIKRIRRDRDLQPALRQRLLREARAVAGLSHPAVVQVYDLIEDASGDCLVLEYVEGQTLAVKLAGGPLMIAHALRLAREIASGLAAAHAAGIVHRDLKPENVIVTPPGRAKVLDFGLARMRARATDEVLLTQQGAILGTYHTMSPEQAGGGEADERSDLFSLGVLLYEMLTGFSPFRGANPLETLKRVISEHPPRVDALRLDVPPALGGLVERLLAKEPGARPRDAATVEREIETIEASLLSGESVSDLSTIAGVRRDEISRPLARPPRAPASTAGLSVLPRRRFLREAALAVVLAALVGAGYVLYRQPQEPEKPTEPAPVKPLRVVVPRPQIAGDDERLTLAASGVLTASLNTLASLKGVAAVDPLQIEGSPKSPVEIARVAAADEILAATLERSGNLGRITLRRIQGSDGRSLWTDTFDAPIEARDLRMLANAVGIHLRRGYPGLDSRRGTQALDVRDDDYAAFLEIKQQMDAGKVPSQADLAGLDRIIASSPRFPEARVLAAKLLWTRFQSTREIAYRNRALERVREARELTPDDPDPLITQLTIELAGDQPGVAAATLARIENLLPGDPRILFLRADLAEREGRTEEALADKRIATERFPSWQNLYGLADLEARTGHIEDARGHLRKILASSPGNIWALDKLAMIELLFGDLSHAEQMYQTMIARTPYRPHLTNLGVVRVLLGRHEDAIAAFHQALAIDPDHIGTTLNLAEAELALDRTGQAEAHFRKVLREIEKNRTPAGFSAASMVQAQCLAHLGRTRDAVEITQGALGQNPDDPDVLQSAALVYALVGDRASALVTIKSALHKGVKPRWFNLPGFESLRNDPEFHALLRGAPGTPRSKRLPAQAR